MTAPLGEIIAKAIHLIRNRLADPLNQNQIFCCLESRVRCNCATASFPTSRPSADVRNSLYPDILLESMLIHPAMSQRLYRTQRKGVLRHKIPNRYAITPKHQQRPRHAISNLPAAEFIRPGMGSSLHTGSGRRTTSGWANVVLGLLSMKKRGRKAEGERKCKDMGGRREIVARDRFRTATPDSGRLLVAFYVCLFTSCVNNDCVAQW